MALPVTVNIPISTGMMSFTLEAGASTYIVGANGSGKTRLSVLLEGTLSPLSHRISAHRALILRPSIEKVNADSALRKLRGGEFNERVSSRWGYQAEVGLLNDFDGLIQLLFAEQNNTALETHQRNRAGDHSLARPTYFEKLTKIWDSLLPHRSLKITGDNIEISANGNFPYAAGNLSDGERALFYLIGQTICAVANSILIFDEPELHVHRAILPKLWDELEAARPDCSFVFFSHDLEFVASRVGKKYVIRDYFQSLTQIPGRAEDRYWDIEEVPSTGFTEEITTQILGSRKPILFIEGQATSLDFAVYRNCYPDWTVIHRNSCEEVIHAVVTMRHNASLTRITCSGIVDADDYDPSDIEHLNNLGIKVLPVSEIENLFLLPEIAQEIGRHEGFAGEDLEQRLLRMNSQIIDHARQGKNAEQSILRYCRRRIDRILKKIDLSGAETVADVASEYSAKTSSLNIEAIANTRKDAIDRCIANFDVPGLMALYDNKGLISIVASQMKGTRKDDFESWIVRILGNNSIPAISSAFKALLPDIKPA